MLFIKVLFIANQFVSLYLNQQEIYVYISFELPFLESYRDVVNTN